VVSRLHRMALLCLALLCAVTIGAGAAVARLLPPRLARWHIPTVAGRLSGAAGAVLTPAGLAGAAGAAAGPAATPAGVAAILRALAGSPALGSHAGVEVTDLRTGQVLYARSAGSGFAPASTTKVATATAALAALGADARFATRVVAGSVPGTIVLVGGGDPTLAAGRPPASDYPRPASLLSLAAATARALRARGETAVRLAYDTSLFTGPAFAPGWTPGYVTTGNVTAITALEVDQGRLTPSGAPQDADVPANARPRSSDPAAEAAQAFAGFLARDGIRLLGTPAPGAAGRGARPLATVWSPPLAAVIAQMLTESNNVIAENLARHVAIATGRPASFSGAAAAEQAVLGRLGVPGGVHLVDGSGLSPRDRVTPAALIKLLAVAAASPRLRPVLAGLPVAGFSGTLGPGGSAFATIGRAGLGTVRAKTGNLTTVAALAGIAYARNGELISFAIMADRLPANGLAAGAADMARIATALAGCGCH